VLGLTDDFLFRSRLGDTERVPVGVGGGKHAGLWVSFLSGYGTRPGVLLWKGVCSSQAPHGWR
jgi:hypothetical protein